MDRDLKPTADLVGLERAVAEHVRQLAAAAEMRYCQPSERIYSEDRLARFGFMERMDASAARTVNLPRAVTGVVGRPVAVKNESAGTSTITIQAHGGDVIDGSTSTTITTAWGVVRLQVSAPGRWVSV